MSLKPQPTTRPIRATNPSYAPEAPAFTDADLVCVLHGFGKILPTHKHMVDTIEFVGGVARNVPFSLARHWAAGTRPDGRKAEGRVKVTILKNDADEEDMLEAAGLRTEDIAQLAKRYKRLSAKDIIREIGFEAAQALAEAIEKEKSTNF